MSVGHTPAVIIEPPRIVIERHDGKMVETERDAFVKISTRFKAEMSRIDPVALKVWLYIALSVDRTSGRANPGLRTIARDCGLAVNTVRSAIERLENEYHLLVVYRGERRYNIYEPVEFVSARKSQTGDTNNGGKTVSNSDTDKSRSVSKFDTDNGQSVSNFDTDESRSVSNFDTDGAQTVSARLILNQINNNNINTIRNTENDNDKQTDTSSDGKKNAMQLEWQLAYGDIDNDSLVRRQMEDEKLRAFEVVLGFNPLPWDNPRWKRLREFVLATPIEAFRRFAQDRKNGGKYSKLPGNHRIYADHGMFIAIMGQYTLDKQDELLYTDNSSNTVFELDRVRRGEIKVVPPPPKPKFLLERSES